MEKTLTELTFELKDALNDSEEVKHLFESEKKMEECEEVMALSYRFSCAQTEYNDILKIYSKESDEAKVAQHKLFLAKKELDEHPFVREYMKHYSEVRKMYSEINDELFGRFQIRCEHKKD